MDAMTQAALAVTLMGRVAGAKGESAVMSAIDDLDKQVVDGIMSKLEKNQGLLAQEAIQAWQQLFANRRLRRHLDRTRRASVASAVAAKPMMDGQKESGDV